MDTSQMTEVFCRHIIRNGKTIFPKRSQIFHFWVKTKRA